MNSERLNAIFRKHRQWTLVVLLARLVQRSGGRVLVVGGAVRDTILINIQHSVLNIQYRRRMFKDIDLEVYGLEKDALRKLLEDVSHQKHLALNEVGKQFGVFNLGGLEIAIPRTDSRTRPGMGRKPQVISQPSLTFGQASRRRDLTINALAFDPLTGEVLDAHHGLADLQRGVLRAVDPKSFGDDPLRVLRVMQFVGRFGFKIHPDLVRLCRRISLKQLAKERVGEEWTKLLLNSSKPSLAIEAGYKLKIFDKLHLGLARLKPADRKATEATLDDCARILAAQTPSTKASSWPSGLEKVLMLVALCHRLPAAAAERFLGQINCPSKETSAVMRWLELLEDVRMTVRGLKRGEDEVLGKSVRFWAYELSQVDTHLTFKGTATVCEVFLGRPVTEKLIHWAKAYHVWDRAPRNLLTGKAMLGLGIKPGKKMGELLRRAFREQLEGRFDDKHHKPQKKLSELWVVGQA